MRALSILTFASLVSLMPLLADSPVTSTAFYTAYLEYQQVKDANKAGVLTKELAHYLVGQENPLGIKAAVINGLSWDLNGKRNAQVFKGYLASKYGVGARYLKLGRLSADELFSLGYLTLLDDYFKPQKAIPILELASRKKSTSYTIAVVLSLARAQKAINSDWCEIWYQYDKVNKDPLLNRDLRAEAIEIIMNYMHLYKKYCE